MKATNRRYFLRSSAMALLGPALPWAYEENGKTAASRANPYLNAALFDFASDALAESTLGVVRRSLLPGQLIVASRRMKLAAHSIQDIGFDAVIAAALPRVTASRLNSAVFSDWEDRLSFLRRFDATIKSQDFLDVELRDQGLAFARETLRCNGLCSHFFGLAAAIHSLGIASRSMPGGLQKTLATNNGANLSLRKPSSSFSLGSCCLPGHVRDATVLSHAVLLEWLSSPLKQPSHRGAASLVQMSGLAMALLAAPWNF